MRWNPWTLRRERDEARATAELVTERNVALRKALTDKLDLLEDERDKSVWLLTQLYDERVQNSDLRDRLAHRAIGRKLAERERVLAVAATMRSQVVG
jgi:hypothetical protein